MSSALCEPFAPEAPEADVESFDDVVIAHLDDAYRLARWLMGNDEDAEDVVQDASLRAFRYFRTFTGGNGRAWFLSIVRNTCRGRYGQRSQAASEPFEEDRHSQVDEAVNPESLLLQTDHAALVERVLSHLPDRYRQLLVRRELQGLSYRELSAEMGIPLGTVMSGLSRARRAFRDVLGGESLRATDGEGL
jgi:RNA polymerase sigma-70 factor, ECF subfamily